MSGTPQLDDLVNDLKILRRRGIARLAELEVPALRACTTPAGHDPAQLRPHHLEAAINAALVAMGDGDTTDIAAALFGITSQHRGMHPIELRKRAAEIAYDRPGAVDSFRKAREPLVIAALASALLALADDATPAPAARPASPRPAVPLPMTRLVIDQEGWRARSLPVLAIEPQRAGQLRELTWPEFGAGIDVICSQIHHYGTTLDIDLVVGVNEAGLVMATLLASASFQRCAIGYIRTSRGRIDEPHSLLGPQLKTASAVLICDFEVKTRHVLGQVINYLTDAGLPPATPRYFAVMGALATENRSLDTLGSLDVAVALNRLACQPVLQAAQLTDAFIGGLMASPGIDPPLGLR